MPTERAAATSWFSIFSPRAETFDLSLRPRLPNGEPPGDFPNFRGPSGHDIRASGGRENGTVPLAPPVASLGWFGKAGNGFNGMYNRDMQNSAPLGSQGYSIGPTLDTARDVPIQAWSCKNFVYRWLGRGDCPDFRPSTRGPANDIVGENGTGYSLGALVACGGLEFALQEDNHQPTGTITNHLKPRGASSA